jgi:hypothetical protein
VRIVSFAVLLGLAAAPAATAAPPDAALAKIKAVGKEGAGNPDAAAAWKELVALGPDALFPTLTAMGDADLTAANWLLSAVDAITEKQIRNKAFPADQIEAYVKSGTNPPRSRRVAYELLTKVDPAAPNRLLPGMLDDPNLELRRDAVAAALKKAAPLANVENAKHAYQKLLLSARDKDQLEAIAKKLKELGVVVELTKHMNFVTRWSIIGPFDHAKGIGWDRVYPPETGVDLKAEYAGKDGKPARWKGWETRAEYGVVDLNQAVAELKGAVAYARAVIQSDLEQPVEVRVGSIVGIQVFLNGQRIYAKEEYHHGMDVDQYAARATLKAGRNELLLKVCQNEQTEPHAKVWMFQARICDATGAAVPMRVVDELPLQVQTEEKKEEKK